MNIAYKSRTKTQLRCKTPIFKRFSLSPFLLWQLRYGNFGYYGFFNFGSFSVAAYTDHPLLSVLLLF